MKKIKELLEDEPDELFRMLERVRSPHIRKSKLFSTKELLFGRKNEVAWRKAVSEWAMEGVLYETRGEEQKGKMRKFSVVEVAWLRLVYELRKFSVSFETIKWLKLNLVGWHSFDEETREFNLLLKYFERMIAKAKKGSPLANYAEYLEAQFERWRNDAVSQIVVDDLDRLSPAREMAIFCDAFSLIIAEACVLRRPVHLFIYANGSYETIYWDKNDNKALAYREGPCIIVPVSYLVADLLFNEEVYSKLPDIISLDKKEKQLIKLVRSGEAKQIVVKLDDDSEITLFREHKKLNVDIKTRLCDLIMSKGYQEISIKARNGKIVAVENTKSTKPRK